MRTPAHHSTRGALSSQVETPRPDELVRRLVDCLTVSNGSSSGNGIEALTEEVVLDIDINGVRYLLVRMPSHSRVGVQLSPREHEIVRMVAMGHPNKVIAAVLSISSWTVCTHLRRIFAKLGVGSRAAMVARLHEVRQLDAVSGLAKTGLSSATTLRDGLPRARHQSHSSVAKPGRPRCGSE